MGAFQSALEQDVFVVRMPAYHEAILWMEGETPGISSATGHDKHGIASLLATGIGDPFAVGRESGTEDNAWRISQPSCEPAFRGNLPKVVFADKDKCVGR
jgi:hypothetical protein